MTQSITIPTKPKENITLCYRTNNYSQRWTCEYGFDSVRSADERAHKVIQCNAIHETRLFPFNAITPISVQRAIIKTKLMVINNPEITMVESRKYYHNEDIG